jgi:hypothetical protein
VRSLERVARISAADCAAKPVVGPLPAGFHDAAPAGGRIVRTEGVAFGFATEHEHTLNLLDEVWDGHIEAGGTPDPAKGRESEAGDTPDSARGRNGSSAPGDVQTRIAMAAVAGMRGRFVDPVNGRQLLAFDYAPFTLIKQSLRWEYARQSVASGLVPLHGVIVEAGGRRLAMSARGQSGKSYLADRWLAADASARVLVDDWSLLEASTRRVKRVGDASLHVRGSAFERESQQLSGAEPVTAELCEDDPSHNESRFLVRRERLHRFQHDEAPRELDALVLIREPFGERFCIDDGAAAVNEAFVAEASTFWDDSLIGLPEHVVEHLREAWRTLLAQMRVLVMQGHRRVEADAAVAKLQDALAG